MVKFSFTADGRIVNVLDEFGSLRNPGRPISAEVTALTGITNEMVAGKSIDPAVVEQFAGDAVLVIAHSASFDRPFCEKLWPIFAARYWACSNRQVDWRARGHEGTRLAYLLNDIGYFHDGHRALDDCHALLEVLATARAPALVPALASLLENARKSTIRIWADGAPYETKEQLRARGYRWSDGSGGSMRSWWLDVEEGKEEAELAYLRKAVFGGVERDLPVKRLTGLDRFSSRS